MTLVIRDAEIDGHSGQDVRIVDSRITEIGPRIDSSGAIEELDARGGALIPGLIHHHIHLMATAPRAHSLPLHHAARPARLSPRLPAFSPSRPPRSSNP